MRTTFISLVILSCLVPGLNASASTHAYVTNYDGGAVLDIQTSDGTIVQTTPTGGGPYGVAVDPSGNRVYVTNELDDTVSVISTSDHVVTDTVSVGAGPLGIAADPLGGLLYVTNYDDDTLSVISAVDEDSNSVIAILDVGAGPYGVAVTPDGTFVYIANYLDGSVSVISTSGATTIVGVGQGPLGVAIDPDGTFVYVTNHLDDTLSVIRANDGDADTGDGDNQVVAVVGVGQGPFGVVVGSTGETVYVTNHLDGTVSAVSTQSLTVIDTIPVGSDPLGVAMPRNGISVYVINGGDATISVIDIADHNVTTLALDANVSPVGFGSFIGGLPPTAPSGLEATAESESKILLTWKDNSYEELGFKIERVSASGLGAGTEDYAEVARVDGNVNSYLDSGLGGNTTYYYRIVAYNEAADSSPSLAAAATTAEEDPESVCFLGMVDPGAQSTVRVWVALILTALATLATAGRRATPRSARETEQ